MNFQRVVQARRMVRNYAPEPVPTSTVERILSNALHAPSAGFSQGWAFLLLDQPADVAAFWDCTTDRDRPPDSWLRGMMRAPVVIVPLASKQAYLDRYAEADKGWIDRSEANWPIPYWYVDTGMAVLLILQTVTDEGLGACFFGVPADRWIDFRTTFAIPDTYAPLGAVTIGHRAPDRQSPSLARGRRGLSEVVHRGRWQPG